MVQENRGMKLILLLISVLSLASPAVNQIDPEQPLMILGRGVPVDAQWSADGKRLIVASAGGLWLYDNLSAEPQFIDSRDNPIYTMAVGQSSTVATGHEDGSIHVW